MTTKLIIARHGNTFAAGDVVTRVGVTDLPLVETGLLQGRKIGAYLKQHQLIPDVIFTSQLQRTQQTAEQAQQVMQTQIPTQSLAIFNEIDYGPDENQPEDIVIARIGKEALAAWEKQAIVPAGWKINPKTIINDWLAFSSLLQKDYPNKTILVVTSNGIARFAPYLTGDFNAFSSKHHIKIATGALCLFEITPPNANWQCVGWNIKPD